MNCKLRNMTSVYFVREDAVLCLYRIGSRVANNKFIGSAGGHFQEGELNDPRACILREMGEELGLVESDIADLSLRYITHRLKNGEIRQNYYYFARLKSPRDLISTEGDLQWIPWEKLPGLDMPVSAKHMILHYYAQGRFTDCCYCGITQPEGTKFQVLQEFEG